MKSPVLSTRKKIILASSSSSRAAILEQIGLEFEALAPKVDESSIREALVAVATSPRDIADALADAKARKISIKNPDALVLGSDQILEFEETIVSKASSKQEARETLERLVGKTHVLNTAIVIYHQAKPIWRHVAKSQMMMRSLSTEVIAEYVDTYWDHIKWCVGCYRIEAEGAALFRMIRGDQFEIRGLPLFPLLNFLQDRGDLHV